MSFRLAVPLGLCILAACSASKPEVFDPSTVGTEVEGDFNGDGRLETATMVKVRDWEQAKDGAEDGWKGQHEVRFSDKNLRTLDASLGGYLVREGDLNGDGAEELSIFMAPNHGCTYAMRTYGQIAGQWREVVPVFMAPTFCDPLNGKDLQAKVFQEQGQIYFLSLDMDAFNEERVVWAKRAVPSAPRMASPKP
jgi:hypothetical protein